MNREIKVGDKIEWYESPFSLVYTGIVRVIEDGFWGKKYGVVKVAGNYEPSKIIDWVREKQILQSIKEKTTHGMATILLERR